MSLLIPAILCGGAGTRLWPMSTKARAKQFLPLVTDKSLLAETIARALTLPGAHAENVVVVAGESQLPLVREAAAQGGAPHARIVLEPEGKNTFPAALLAAKAACEIAPDALVLLLPADHHIGDLQAMRDVVARAAPLAAEGRLVTFGVRPTRPHTGYGYIKRGEPLSDGVFAVAEFKEKPDLPVAEHYLAHGGYDWNAGIFMFRADWFLAEAQALQPEIAACVAQAWAQGARDGVIRPNPSVWAGCAADSIDYAIAEKTAHAAIAPVDMAWSDVGSWATLWEIAGRDEAGNAKIGPAIVLNSVNCYARASADKPIALIGLEDVVVIDSPEGVLVARRDQVEAVKAVVAAVKALRGE